MSKEIKELKKNYYKVLILNKKDDYENKTLNKCNNIFKNKVLYHSPTSMYYTTNKDFTINNKDIFNKTSIQFYTNNKNKKNKIHLHIISLKNNTIKKINSNNNESSFKMKIKKKEKSLKEINIRLYYRPIKYKFGYKQIKDKYKLTEMAALNFAKKKRFDTMGLINNI